MGVPKLRVRLFGELDLTYDGVRLSPLESARSVSLLAYLILNQDAPQRRERLAFLLWPDSTESQARTNLRHVLHNLRRAIPYADQFLEITPRTIRWRSDSDACADVTDFEDQLRQAADAEPDEAVTRLHRAARLCTGDLLTGYDDEWILTERERLRQLYASALERLIVHYEAQGNLPDAIAMGERLLRHDPLNEGAHRALMRLYDAQGNRAKALQQFHVCASTLERELGAGPSVETVSTYEALLPAADFDVADDRIGGKRIEPPFIGRLTERRQLTSSWHELPRSGPRFVLITGEAGIGKTRLAEDVAFWCAHRGGASASARSYEAEGTLPYGSLVSWLRSRAFTSRFERLDPSSVFQLARLVPELVAGRPDQSQLAPGSETEQRQRLFDAAARLILATPDPVVLLADDVQWFDRETLQFMHYLVRVDPSAPLLIIATSRADEIDHRHPVADLLAGLTAMDRLIQIDLQPISIAETGALAEGITGHAMMGEDIDALYRDTEGNPLFVVEALRAGWEEARQSGSWTSSKIRAVVEGRLARLSVAAQELIGVAATIGREFDSDVLAHASGIDEETLVSALDELWRRHLIREHEDTAYDFTHHLIREVAYQSMSPAVRRHHHLRIARSLAHLKGEGADTISVDIARHFEAGGDTNQAIIWFRRAAEASQRVFASADAIDLLYHALGLIRGLAQSLDRDAMELDILSTLPGPLLARDAYASNHLTELHTRARELSRSSGIELTPPLLRSIAVSDLSHGDFENAQRVGQQIRSRAHTEQDDALFVEAAYVLGIAAFWKGQFEEARQHFELAVRCYRDQDRNTHLLHYGQDPKAICLSRLANTQWFLGRADEATRARDLALRFADEIEHPISRSTVLVFSALLDLDMHDLAQFRQHVAALHDASGTTGARQVRIARSLLDSFLDVVDRHDKSGIIRLLGQLENRQEIELAPGNVSVTARLLLAASAEAGDSEAGIAAADLALRTDQAGPWESEIRRLRATFLDDLGAPVAEVEAEFTRAIETARKQSTRLLEVRASTCLLRHYVRHGRSSEKLRVSIGSLVRELESHGSSPDLIDARSLLATS